MREKSIIFIVNGDLKTGYGHLSRCLVIADMFSAHGYDVVFLMLHDSPFIGKVKERYSVCPTRSYDEKDAAILIRQLTDKFRVNVCLIDLIEKEYDKLAWMQKSLKRCLITSITLFLFADKKRFEDLSFFPSIDTPKKRTVKTAYGDCLLLSGRDYLTFRPEFKGIIRTNKQDADKVLISMGGTDPYGLALKVIKSIVDLPIEITVIASKLSSYYEELNDIAKKDNSASLTLIEPTEKMVELMSKNDIMILNGGLTRYEACLCQIPFIAISIHEVQFNITKQLTDLGVGLNLGVANTLSDDSIKREVAYLLKHYEEREKMSNKMKTLFNTNGASNIYSEVTKRLELQ